MQLKNNLILPKFWQFFQEPKDTNIHCQYTSQLVEISQETIFQDRDTISQDRDTKETIKDTKETKKIPHG